MYHIAILLQRLIYVGFYLFLKVFLRLEIKGQEHLNSVRGPVILAMNHTSELDPFVVLLALPFFSSLFPVHAVAYQFDEYTKPSFGLRRFLYQKEFFKLLGAIPIESGHHSYEFALHKHIELLKKGQTVGIFPEGKVTQDGKIGPARGGLGYLSYSTKAVIIPIGIKTLFNINISDFIMRKRKLTIVIGVPLSPQDIIDIKNDRLTQDDFRAASQKVLSVIDNMISSF